MTLSAAYSSSSLWFRLRASAFSALLALPSFAAAQVALPQGAGAPAPTPAAASTVPASPDVTSAAAASAQDGRAVGQPTAASRQDDDVDQAIADFTRGPPAAGQPPAPDDGPRQIHGEIGAAVGSQGYSSAYVEAEIPIGSDSTLGVAVGENQQQLYRHGPTVTGKSLSLSLVLGQPEMSTGCAPPPEASGQPTSLWTQQMRDGANYGRDGCRPSGGYGFAPRDWPAPQP